MWHEKASEIKTLFVQIKLKMLYMNEVTTIP